MKINHLLTLKNKIQKILIDNKISIIAEIKKASPSAGDNSRKIMIL